MVPSELRRFRQLSGRAHDIPRQAMMDDSWRELLDDRERQALHPETRLRAWEVDARQPGADLSVSVLVDPSQPVPTDIMDRLLATDATTVGQQLAIADAASALACIGAAIPDALERRIAAWLPGIVASAGARSIDAGLAALAYGDIASAQQITPARRGRFVGGLVFPRDLLGLLSYAIAAVQAGASAATMRDALHRLGERLGEPDGVGPATLLWLGRVVFHRLGKRRIGEVATAMHDVVWNVPVDLDRARRESPATARTFALDRYLDGGRFRIDHHLLGTGTMRLYRGVEVASGAPVLVSLDAKMSRQSVEELRAAVDRAGSFELAFVGPIDNDDRHWAVVERVPLGAWLPSMVRPGSTPMALGFGISAGRIMLATSNDPALTGIRPELMWGHTRDGRYEVTGLSTRPLELFARHRGDAFTDPLFEVFYRAPEARLDPDDRALSYTLAVMIAEWASGRYPLHQVFGHETTDHDPIRAEPELAALLERGLAPSRDLRPRLADFVDALERLAR